MARRWTESEDTVVRLAAALDFENGGRRLRELADRLGRTEAAVRWRTWQLRAAPIEVAVDVTAMLEHRAADSDAPCGVPQAVPLLDDVADPCLRW